MSDHRAAEPRPRYGRLAGVAAAATVTAISVVGGLGLLPSSAVASRGSAPDSAAAPARPGPVAELVAASDLRSAGPGSAVSRDTGVNPSAGGDSSQSRRRATGASGQVDRATGDVTALPADSGQGRRIVFSESAQRVWLVDASGSVRRTYLVSGSKFDNLDPGTYSVYSKSRWAVGVDDSGVMQYYVRFAHGPHSTIGFHTIPTHLGERLQTVKDLGTPQSHGCIRQRTPDAIALWEFAPVGTEVVVV